MWGCFCKTILTLLGALVFPTHVGVFLLLLARVILQVSIPHSCGGVSTIFPSSCKPQLYSPLMWGCFPIWFYFGCLQRVFPTHVGVFPKDKYTKLQKTGIPHSCGGVSSLHSCIISVALYSPLMWGCFFPILCLKKSRIVFPTHVGVFPKVVRA